MNNDDTPLVWPEFLGLPQRAGYSYTPSDRRAKAEMEIGSRYRILYDTDETVVHCDFVLHYDALAFFEAFEKHMLKQGSVWFTMPLLTAGAIERHTVRLRERPKIGSFRGDTALVSMVLDVADRKTKNAQETWVLYFFGMDFFPKMRRLYEIVHDEAPGATTVSL